MYNLGIDTFYTLCYPAVLNILVHIESLHSITLVKLLYNISIIIIKMPVIIKITNNFNHFNY